MHNPHYPSSWALPRGVDQGVPPSPRRRRDDRRSTTHASCARGRGTSRPTGPRQHSGPAGRCRRQRPCPRRRNASTRPGHGRRKRRRRSGPCWAPGHLGTVELGSDTPRSLPLAKPVRADDWCMARLGRRPVPSGPNSDTAGTWNLTVRMPASFKEHVTARGAQQGLSCSDVIANAVAQVLDLAPVMTPRNVDEDQGELLAS